MHTSTAYRFTTAGSLEANPHPHPSAGVGRAVCRTADRSLLTPTHVTEMRGSRGHAGRTNRGCAATVPRFWLLASAFTMTAVCQVCSFHPTASMASS